MTAVRRADRVAIVTGGGRGLGATTARELAGRGFRVVVNYFRRAEAAEAVVRAIADAGGTAIAVPGDVRVAADARRLVRTAVDEWGRVDVLVCNANVGLALGPVDRVDWADFAAKMTDELAAAFHVTQAALPVMADQRYGRIVYVSSEAAKGPIAVGMGAHSTAKAALNAYARVVAREAAPHGVVANVVSCGFVRTDATKGVSDEQLARVTARTPVGRPADGIDIARVIALFAGDDVGFMTGTVTPVNGGADIPVH